MRISVAERGALNYNRTKERNRKGKSREKWEYRKTLIYFIHFHILWSMSFRFYFSSNSNRFFFVVFFLCRVSCPQNWYIIVKNVVAKSEFLTTVTVEITAFVN